MTEIHLTEDEIVKLATVGTEALGEAFGRLAAQLEAFRRSMQVAGAYTVMANGGSGKLAAYTNTLTDEEELERLIQFAETLRNEARRRLSTLAAYRIGNNYPG